MWESSHLSLLEISFNTNVNGKICFRQLVLYNHGKFTNFPFDIGSLYLSRWQCQRENSIPPIGVFQSWKKYQLPL
jgi:hypothetical protein